jgi:hypothetical protein
MDKDKALKLALDALEESETNNDTMEFWDRKTKAITAIKQALTAQPAPVQPVGTYGEIYESMQALLRTGLQRDQQIYMEMKDKPLYTTPPAAKRQWVGLTDEEMNDITCGMVKGWVMERLAIAIEAKLKELNT